MNEEDPLELSKGLIGSMGIDLSPGSLLAGFVFSVIGLYLFREGKKRQNQGVLWTGITLMVYPLFIGGTLNLWLAGLGLCGAAYYFWTRGESV